MNNETTTETEITQDDIKQLRTQEKKKSLASRLSEFKSLRGGKSPGRKSQGIMARWLHLEGPDKDPIRVLIMPVRQEPKSKDDGKYSLDRQMAAQLKRERKNQMRIQNAWRQSLGQTFSKSSGALITFDVAEDVA